MSSRLWFPLLCLLAVTWLIQPLAAEEPDPLAAKVKALLGSEAGEARDALLTEVKAAAAKVDPARLAGYLARGRAYSADVPTGWLERKNLCTDGVERGYLLFVPEDYTPEKKYRLLIDMHGGVSRAELPGYEQLEGRKFFWGEHAAEQGYLLAFPSGQKDAVWWDAVGSRNVLDLILRVKREYNVDENQVLATGFSDGASGSYYLALAHTTPFAGFIPLNGHVGVAGVGGLQVHLPMLVNKPIYAVNTDQDGLYPSKALKPIMEAIQKLGAPLIWRDIAGFGHDPSYLPEERPAIAAWMKKVRRVPHPRKVVWEGAADRPGRVHWLQVRQVADRKNDSDPKDGTFEDVNPAPGPGRARIGINVDQAFEGVGVKVSVVSKGSSAAAVRLVAGDVLTRFDEKELSGLADLRTALSSKKPGDAFSLRLKRGEAERLVIGRFPTQPSRPAFRREKSWGSLRAAVKGNVIDVRVRRIGAFDLYLSPTLVDLSKPVVVKVNGAVVHDAVVAPDIGFMLEQALKDEDRSLVYSARLQVTVPLK